MANIIRLCNFKNINLLLTAAWAVMLPVAYMTGWIYSIAFISLASIYANFASHLAAWRADVPIEGEDNGERKLGD